MIWNSNWIFLSKELRYEKQAILLRRSFRLDAVPAAAAVGVSADSRYILYVNGMAVSRGPLKGDLTRRYFDRVDIAPYLKSGENVLAARVLHFYPDPAGASVFECGPVSVVSTNRGGFLLQPVECKTIPCTDETWKVIPDPSYAFVHSVEARYAGDMERVDGGLYPQGWNLPGFDDAAWPSAEIVTPAREADFYGSLSQWPLIENSLPPQLEEAFDTKAVLRQSGPADFTPLLEGNAVTIPAYSVCTAEFDLGELSTCFVKSILSGGEGAELEYLYSECYSKEQLGTGRFVKDRRDGWEDGVLFGEADHYRKGRGRQSYEPFFFRTLRYLKLTVKTGEEPLRFEALGFRMTSYPLELQTDFHSPDATLQSLWEISLRTLRRCMHETFEDCPFYEQMQYLMDTTVQHAFSLRLSEDDRLLRKSMLDFHSAQLPNGLLPCTAPSQFTQMIPGFALFFIDMADRHYLYKGDLDIPRAYLPTMLEILDFFRNKLDSVTGLIKKAGFWEFVDWVDDWDEGRGKPNRPGEPYNYIYSLYYAYGLLRTAYLAGELGLADLREQLLEEHDRLAEAVNRTVWDEETSLYRDAPGNTTRSQQAQLWAVLSECVQGEEAHRLMKRSMEDTSLLQCSYVMSFYLFRALEKAEAYRHSTDWWRKWTSLLPLGVTTWPEDDVSNRSECHAWSSLPLYEFPAMSLGIRPEGPGYRTVLVAPAEFALGDMEATLHTARGPVKASRKRRGDMIRFDYAFPGPTPVHVRIPGSDYCDTLEALSFEIPAETN
ncbi:MAG: alpha-L-rhamnosidase C-terminal domain-containing protein [Oscillospiraceae bacterium]